VDLTNEDVADILALLDSLPYDELDLETTRFRLTLRRTPGGWTQSAQVLADPAPTGPDAGVAVEATDAEGAGGSAGEGGAEAGRREAGLGRLVGVRAPLPGTFYRAPAPGAAPFVAVGSRVSADSVVGIVETMKLMNPVHAGVEGTVAEICLGNGEFAAHGATLVRIEVDR
jgi:acetyl-CoA carboxylase biotin carboxyl carrier protein